MGTPRHAARKGAGGSHKRNLRVSHPLSPCVGGAIRKLFEPAIDIRLDATPLPRPEMEKHHLARGTSVYGGHGQLRLPHGRSWNDPAPGFGSCEDEAPDSNSARSAACAATAKASETRRRTRIRKPIAVPDKQAKIGRSACGPRRMDAHHRAPIRCPASPIRPFRKLDEAEQRSRTSKSTAASRTAAT